MMTDLEGEFLLAVQRGELDTLRQFLKTRSLTQLDINCRDPLDRNALILSIGNKDLDTLNLLLLEKDIRLGDALLYAIQENYVEAVEALLNHLSQSNDNNNKHHHQHIGLQYEHEHDHYYNFGCDMSPLMLAAQKNNPEIVKLLLDRNISPIKSPHDPRCGCNACCLARSRDCLVHSRSRINAYKALSSPSLMALSSADPLETAFEMSAKLESLAQLEPEYKEEYMRLRSQCQAFATRLLDYARTSRELETLLDFNGSSASSSNELSESDKDEDEDEPDDFGVAGSYRPLDSRSNLARLKLAIQCKQKTFCAHPNVQELLATMWYENLPGFRRMTFAQQTLQVLGIGLMFPVYSMAYIIAPNTHFGQYIKKPFIKFICHSASYITFIMLLVLASQRVEAFYSWSLVLCLFGIHHTNTEQSGLFGPINSNLSLFEQTIAGPPPLPSSGYNDDLELGRLASFYKQTMSQAQAAGGGGPDSLSASTARGLDSLSKIFGQLPASSKKRGTLPSPIESVILIWVVSLIWAELKQIRALGINYYKHDMWNLLDSVASGCYIGTIILRLVSYIQADDKSLEVAREHWNAYDPTLLSEGLFATATVFSSLKLVYIFSVNPYLGPLQISLGRMIVDILRFSWIYMLVLFAFACGMNQLLWYYADLERHQCLNVTNYNLAQYYKTKHDLQLESAAKAAGGQGSPAAPKMITGNQSSLVGGGLKMAPTPSPLIMPAGTDPSNATAAATSTASFASVIANISAAGNISIPAPAGSNETQPPSSEPLDFNGDAEGLLSNMTEDDLIESAFSASLEDDSRQPPVTIDDSCKTWRHFSNVFESSQTLFWANFGLVDLENFDLTGIRQYTRFWALLMFGSYCFINVIVVLNLLVAMMNHSYDKISTRSDIEWKFARTRLWMSYFDTGSTVPAPFNIIPSIKSMRYFCRRARKRLGRLYECWNGSSCSSACGWMARCRTRTTKNSNNNADDNMDARRRPANGLERTGAEYLKNNKPDYTKHHQHHHHHGAATKLKPLAGQRRSQISYRAVIETLVRRYLVDEQRKAERASTLTHVKLKRWSKLNIFKRPD
jgi:ankyrin repeat protein